MILQWTVYAYLTYPLFISLLAKTLETSDLSCLSQRFGVYINLSSLAFCGMVAKYNESQIRHLKAALPPYSDCPPFDRGIIRVQNVR